MINKPTYEELEQRVRELEKVLVETRRIQEFSRGSDKRFQNPLKTMGTFAAASDQHRQQAGGE